MNELFSGDRPHLFLDLLLRDAPLVDMVAFIVQAAEDCMPQMRCTVRFLDQTIPRPPGYREEPGWHYPIRSSSGDTVGSIGLSPRGDSFDPPPRPYSNALIRLAALAYQRHRDSMEGDVSLATVVMRLSEIQHQALTVPQRLRHCVETLVKDLDMTAAQIWLVDEIKHEVVLSASAGRSTHIHGTDSSAPRATPLEIGRIIRERRPIVSDELQPENWGGELSWVERADAAAHAGYPLIAEDRVVGVLAMCVRHRLSESMGQALGSIAAGLAHAIVRNRADEERQASLRRMEQRVKELEVLHQTASLLQLNEEMPQLMQRVVSLLPAAWQYPAITAARIRYAGCAYATPGFRDTAWRQCADFSLSDGACGCLEVVYLDERPAEVEGPFLTEERRLLDALAEMLRNDVERRLAEGSMQGITQGIRADQAVVERESRLAAFLEQLPLGVGLLDRAGPWTISNAVMRTFVQTVMPSHDRERAARWRAWDQDGMVLPPGAWPGERVLRGETECPVLDMLFRKDDGTETWTRLRSTPLLDRTGTFTGAICTIEDIDQCKRTQEALKEREHRLQLALTAGQMGTWEFDVDRDEATWDAKAFALLGYDDMNVRPSLNALYAQVHPEDRLRVKQAVHQAVMVGGEFEQEFRIVRPDGQTRWIVSKGVVLQEQAGLARRMTGISYDVTERRLMEEQLRAFARELEGRVEERTADLMQSRERLRALATELNLAEQRERKRVAGELHDHLQQLLVLGKLKLSQGHRLPHIDPACAALISQVEAVMAEALQYTRTLVAELSPPALRDHGLAAGLQWLAEYMTKHDMAVTVVVPDGDQPSLPEEQALLLFQSVRELLMNSWKHAGTGHATVTMAWQAEVLRLEVRDQGKGFESAAAETPIELSSKFGLFSISERMQALGGVLQIESSLGAGTICTLELPVAEPPREDATVRASAAPSAGEKSLRRRGHRIRTVLVDDHAMMRQGLRSVLDRYSDVDVVAEAANGEEALQAVEQFHPAVVVMDIHMPKMNGIEATARLKAQYPDLHIVGLSFNPAEEERETMLKAGASVLLAKESPVEDLYLAVRQAVILKGAA